jgi:hypothetical protein
VYISEYFSSLIEEYYDLERIKFFVDQINEQQAGA